MYKGIWQPCTDQYPKDNDLEEYITWTKEVAPLQTRSIAKAERRLAKNKFDAMQQRYKKQLRL